MLDNHMAFVLCVCAHRKASHQMQLEQALLHQCVQPNYAPVTQLSSAANLYLVTNDDIYPNDNFYNGLNVDYKEN